MAYFVETPPEGYTFAEPAFNGATQRLTIFSITINPHISANARVHRDNVARLTENFKRLVLMLFDDTQGLEMVLGIPPERVVRMGRDELTVEIGPRFGWIHMHFRLWILHTDTTTHAYKRYRESKIVNRRLGSRLSGTIHNIAGTQRRGFGLDPAHFQRAMAIWLTTRNKAAKNTAPDFYLPSHGLFYVHAQLESGQAMYRKKEERTRLRQAVAGGTAPTRDRLNDEALVERMTDRLSQLLV